MARIVIDLQGLQTESRFRGIGRYTESLALALVRKAAEHEMILVLNQRFSGCLEDVIRLFSPFVPRKNILIFSVLDAGEYQEADPSDRVRVEELLWASFVEALKPDLVIISSLFEGDDAAIGIGSLPRRYALAIILYDLIPLMNPAQYLKDAPFRALYLGKVEAAQQCDLFLAISESSRQEGFEYLGVEKQRIFNIGAGYDAQKFRLRKVPEDRSQALKSSYGLDRPFIMAAGAADERKNLPRLIEALALFPEELREKYQLLLVGKMTEGQMAGLSGIAKAHGIGPQDVRFTGYIDDEALIDLYSLTALYVFPSWHEGFGCAHDRGSGHQPSGGDWSL
jgi:glycosyltransferase involved in cell wall biosynthesis